MLSHKPSQNTGNTMSITAVIAAIQGLLTNPFETHEIEINTHFTSTEFEEIMSAINQTASQWKDSLDWDAYVAFKKKAKKSNDNDEKEEKAVIDLKDEQEYRISFHNLKVDALPFSCKVNINSATPELRNFIEELLKARKVFLFNFTKLAPAELLHSFLNHVKAHCTSGKPISLILARKEVLPDALAKKLLTLMPRFEHFMMSGETLTQAMAQQFAEYDFYKKQSHQTIFMSRNSLYSEIIRKLNQLSHPRIQDFEHTTFTEDDIQFMTNRALQSNKPDCNPRWTMPPLHLLINGRVDFSNPKWSDFFFAILSESLVGTLTISRSTHAKYPLPSDIALDAIVASRMN